VQATNDKRQVVPILEHLAERPEDLPDPHTLLAQANGMVAPT